MSREHVCRYHKRKAKGAWWAAQALGQIEAAQALVAEDEGPTNESSHCKEQVGRGEVEGDDRWRASI
eukprot:4161760-Pyramimonas_sp.AAC.1